MSNSKKRVLVFGAGPGGLAAGINLLERGGRENLDVTLITMDHILGGRAKSWGDPVRNDGRFYDYGIHFVFGFYRELRDLMARSGIREDEILVNCRGYHYWYEPRSRKVHEMRTSPYYFPFFLRMIVYDGFSAYEKLNMAQFGLRNINELLLKKDISYLDNICFKAWAINNGLDYGLIKTSFFRFTQDALFNWPYEISAYVCIMAQRHMFGSYENLMYNIVHDGWTRCLWDPMGDYFKRLGGKIVYGTKLTGFQHDGRIITGVTTGNSVSQHGQIEGFHNSPEIPVEPGTLKVWTDFDYIVSAIPADNFKELNPGDNVFWSLPGFNTIRNLTGVAPMALYAFFKEDLKVPYRVQVNAIDPPLFNALDYKPIARPYKNNPAFGSVIHMEGQETGYENLSDQEITGMGLEKLALVPGFEGVRNATLEHSWLHRCNQNHSRILLTDPGTFRFRPGVVSPFRNLFMTGDWIRHDVVLPCMEGAIRTGIEAAKRVVADCGLKDRKG